MYQNSLLSLSHCHKPRGMLETFGVLEFNKHETVKKNFWFRNLKLYNGLRVFCLPLFTY